MIRFLSERLLLPNSLKSGKGTGGARSRAEKTRKFVVGCGYCSGGGGTQGATFRRAGVGCSVVVVSLMVLASLCTFYSVRFVSSQVEELKPSHAR